MTKKDYIIIAEAIKEIIASEADTTSQTHIQMRFVEPFAERLQADNPRFNRKTFISYINK